VVEGVRKGHLFEGLIEGLKPMPNEGVVVRRNWGRVVLEILGDLGRPMWGMGNAAIVEWWMRRMIFSAYSLIEL
jgi:hypothetical protein